MFDVEGLLTIIVVTAFVLAILAMAIRILPEYERGVLFRLGRYIGNRGPGLVIIIPFVDRLVRVSLRTITFDVPTQEVITQDNVTCRVNAVLYYRVVAPEKAILNVEKFHDATSQFAQTTLRSVVGQAYLDELLSQREKLNKLIQKIVDEATEPWGMKVTAVEIKDAILPTEMQRAIARQAEAERERRAIVIQAEGERQAAEKLAEATGILSSQEGSMTLRMLRTLSEMANTPSTKILFPLPMEFRSLLPEPGKWLLASIKGEEERMRKKDKDEQDKGESEESEESSEKNKIDG